MRMITIKGVSRSLLGWSQQPGAAKYDTIYVRLRNQWPAEAAVFAPFRAKPANVPGRGASAFERTGAARPPAPPKARVANPFRPCLGSFRSVPLDCLDVVRRSA